MTTVSHEMIGISEVARNGGCKFLQFDTITFGSLIPDSFSQVKVWHIFLTANRKKHISQSVCAVGKLGGFWLRNEVSISST